MSSGIAVVALDLATCHRHLRAHWFGRIGVTDADGPVVVPVNYVFDGTHVVFRTQPAGLLARTVPGAPVAFEIDAVDARFHEGWSVVVRGVGEQVDPTTLDHESRKLRAWAGEDRDRWLRIRPTAVTGRRIEHHAGA